MAQLEKIANHFNVDVREILPGGTSLEVKSKCSDGDSYWKIRALNAEEKLMRVQKALKHALKSFEELQEAVK